MSTTTETDEQRAARESAERSAQEPRDRRGPDGAKPGESDPLPNSRYAYDADEKAKAREEAPITIGGRVFRRVKKSWDVTRELRKLLRKQERAQDAIMRLEAQKDAKTEKIRGVRDLDTGGWESYPLQEEEAIEAVEREVEALDAKVDERSEESDQAAYNMIRLLLRSTEEKPDLENLQNDESVDAEEYALWEKVAEAHPKPADEFLKAKLDAAEAADLVRLLTSGAEPDPTPATPSS